MMILVMLLFWSVMLTTIIVVTFLSLIRLNEPTTDGQDQWQPSRAYSWDVTK